MEDTDKFNYSEFYYNGPDNDMEGLFVSLTSDEINIIKNKLERFIKLADYIQDNYKELYGSTSDDTTSIAKKMAYDIYDDLLDHANYFCKLISDLVTSSDIEKECDEIHNDKKRFKDCYDEFHFVQNYFYINKHTIRTIKNMNKIGIGMTNLSMNDIFFDLVALFISEFKDIIYFFNTYTLLGVWCFSKSF